MIAVGVVGSLVSVPLALRFLRAEEFGLWVVVFQVTGYLALADTGISSSIGRLLIDHRAHRPSRRYGAVFFGGLVFLIGLAVAILAAGFLLLPFLPHWLNIGENLRHDFQLLAVCQLLIVTASLPIRAVGQTILSASRYDLLHACLSASLVANLTALWLAFALGAEIFSFAWAALAGLLTSILSQLFAARRLGTLPGRNEICLPGRSEWQTIRGFAGDVFFVQLGSTLVLSTQTVIISSTLGLTAAASWAAGSKLFFMFLQVAGKVSEVAGPQMAGLHVAREHERLGRVIRRIVALTVGIASVAALVIVFANSGFVAIWTNGKIPWPRAANLPLAVWLVLASTAAVLTSHALAGKTLSRIRHVYLLEGVFGTALAAWAAPHFGIPGVAAAFALACLLFSFRATVFHFRNS